jgi:competence protein ComEC
VSDGAALACAVGAVVGAWSALPVPPWVGALLSLLALGMRRPALLVVGVALLAAGCSARAWAGVDPVTPASFDDRVTLVADPVRAYGAVTVVVRSGDQRLEAWARGGAARRLERLLAGETVVLRGAVAPAPARMARRLAERHVVGRLTVDEVSVSTSGGALARSTNRLHRVIAQGGRTLPPAERALFTGMVLGDDRAMDPGAVQAFRAAGLSHLTAVSGQNVAFVLTVAGPALRRLRPWPRWAVTLGLLAWFAVLTRFEPSVLRAVGMAGLGSTAFVLGRPASTVRLLALALTAFVIVDPLLVWSVGWWLSAGATLGIAVLAPRISAALPGPRWLALAAGVTIAAQVGVAPVSLAVFGTLPLASVPANVLAGPAAAPVTVWGLPAALVAAHLPTRLAAVVQAPTQLCLRWIEVVASLASRAPLPALRPRGAAVLAALVAAMWVIQGCRRRRQHSRSARTATTGAGP